MFVDIQIGVFYFAMEFIGVTEHNGAASMLHELRGGRAGFNHGAQRGKVAAQYRDAGLGLKGF
jgi:hypothetical protein